MVGKSNSHGAGFARYVGLSALSEAEWCYTKRRCFMAAKPVKLELTLTPEELKILDSKRKRSSRESYLKKLLLETPSSPKGRVKGAISASGKPYIGHALTDEILDDPQAVQRLDDFTANPPKESELIPWSVAKAKLGIVGRKTKRL